MTKRKKTRKPSYIPSKLKIKNKEYKVEARSLSWKSRNKAYGMCDSQNQIIEVAITSDKEENKGTLAHEFAHAYIKENKIKVKKNWTEELLVRLFEDIFSDLLPQIKQ